MNKASTRDLYQLKSSQIRLIVSDFDGTLLPETTMDISPMAHEMVRAVQAHGIRFAGASGRQFYNMKEVMSPVHRHMIFFPENGCCTYEDGDLIDCIEFPVEEIMQLAHEIYADEGSEFVVSGVKGGYVLPKEEGFDQKVGGYFETLTVLNKIEDLTKIDDHFVKISNFRVAGIDEDTRLRYFNKYGERFHAAKSGFNWQDFTVGNKGIAVRRYCERNGIRPEEVLAFGDNYNDIPMFHFAGWPVATCGSVEAVRREALDCTHDVVRTILSFVETGVYRKL